ncbi:hypothetical protein D3C86_1469730 [compost metagenome]
MQGLFGTAGGAYVKAVFTIHNQGWNAGDLIFFGQFTGLNDLSLDRKGVESGQEFFLVYALGSQEVGHIILIGQLHFFVLDRVEHRGMNLMLNTHGLKSQEHLAMSVPRTAEHRWNTLEVHIRWQFFGPGIDCRLKVIAVRAAIPEQLHHFDLARHGDRNRIAQFDIRCGGGVSGLGSHAEQAGSGKNGADDQITHASLLDKFFASRNVFSDRSWRA